MPNPASTPANSRGRLIPSVLLTVGIFVGLLAGFALLLEWKPTESWIVEPMTRFATLVSGGILRLSGFPAEVEGTTLVSGGFSMNVLNGCNGVYAISIFLAAVVAYPSRFPEKIFGAILGSGFLFLVNLIRVISLFLVGMYLPDWLDWIHVYFWQTLIVLIAILTWFFWEERIVRHA